MDKTELFSFVKSDSIKNLIKASEIKTKEDIERLQADNYLIGFTYDELKNVFTEEIADKLYYNNGFNKTFYYDKDKFVLFSVQLYGKQAVLPFDKMTASISKTAEMLEENIENGDYVHLLMVLNDKMRMEMLNLLVENGKVENGYTLFKNFYQTSDYGCSEITTDTMRKLCSMKNREQTAETEKNLSEFPDKVTVYRGEGDRSAKWQNSMSWTTNINVANFFATRMVGDSAKILTAEVDKKDIIEYFEYENECIILPEKIKIINELNLKGKEYLENTLPEIAEWYSEYKGLITEEVDYDSENEHGKEHAARVLLNCLLMAYERKLTMHEMDILAVAAVFHDAARTNDGEDPKHGEECAKYYQKFARSSYLIDEEKIIAQIIKYHCLPDEIGKAEISKRYHKLFDIFKDADALDRVRFGIKALDVNQLRTPEARTMTMVAVASFEGLKIHEIESYYDLDSDVNDDVIDTMNLV